MLVRVQRLGYLGEIRGTTRLRGFDTSRSTGVQLNRDRGRPSRTALLNLVADDLDLFNDLRVLG